MFCQRPMPVSSIPPHHTGNLRSFATLWTLIASDMPPTRPTLILMMPHAPSSMAACASRAFRIASSRQIRVFNSLCRHCVEIEIVIP